MVPSARRERAAALAHPAAGWTLSAVAGLVSGVLGSFHQAWTARVGGVGLPVGAAVCLVVALAVVVAAGRVTGSRVGALSAFVGWMVAVLVLTLPRPEGDLVVPGTPGGYLWLFGGTVLGAGALAWPYGQTVHVRRPAP